MSLIEEDKIKDALNVEGILADFFLKKFEMKGATSNDDKEHRKKSKHKKHKSKKSKRKRKNSSRSSSSERTKHPVALDLGHTSSSEEKDIKRLKKIKKLDSRDPNKMSSYFPVPLTAQTILQTNDNSSALNTSSVIENIPYGPSLELLLTGSESTKAEIDSGIQPKILSPFRDAETSDEKTRSKIIDASVTSEISKEEIAANLTCLVAESSKNQENLSTVANMDSQLQILPDNEEKSESSEKTSIVLKQIDSDNKEIVLNSVKKEIMSDDEKEIKPKEEQSRSRSKSKSKAHRRSRSRSQSKSRTHSTQSKLRKRSRSKSKRRSLSKSRKRSRSKSRRRSLSKSRKRSRSKSRRRSLSKSRKRSRSKSRRRSRSKSRRRSRSRSVQGRYNHKSSKRRSYSRERSKSRRRSRSRYRRISRSRSKSKESSRKRNKRYKSKSRSRSHNNHSRSRSRSYSKDRDKTNHSLRHRSRSHSREYSSRSKRESNHQTRSNKKRSSSTESSSRSKQKSRSKSKEKESGQSKKGKIDQAKILQIAQQNVLNMIEKGTLPEGLSVEHIKKEQFVSLKSSGGKSVQELTDFCAEISKRENDQDGKNQVSTQDGDTGFIHHPFKLKEQSVIKLNIKNAVQIPVKTHAEKFAETAKLSSQFPVSSGNQHKQKELEWIPVEPAKKTTPKVNEVKSVVPVTPKLEPIVKEEPVKSNVTLPSTVPSTVNVSYIPLPSPPIPAMTPPPLPPVPPLPPPPLPPPTPRSQIMTVHTTISQTAKVALPVYSMPSPSVSYPVASPSFSYAPAPSVSYPAQTLSISYPVMSSCVNSFPPLPSSPGLMPPGDTGKPSSAAQSVASVSVKPKPLNMSSIVQMRFKALTKLQEDPNDAEALKTIQEAQTIIQEWVQSQQVPGLFTGSTDAKLLTVEELCGPRHWNYRVKRDIFTRAAPVGEGKGMSLLKKMGWNPGEGLGKNKEGSLEPLVLDIKMDKKGLVSEGEGNKKIVIGGAVKELQGKHPVSALMELCSKRKWKPPLYSIVADTGPPHKKLFLFKVEVNGIEYQPVTPSPNKKIAKADSAVVCLQALNVFPK